MDLQWLGLGFLEDNWEVQREKEEEDEKLVASVIAFLAEETR